MKLKITLLFLIVNFIWVHQTRAQCNADYEERNGIVVIEADSKVSGGWQRRSIQGASGGQALYYNGANQFNNPGTSVITYSVRINQAGTYRVILRNKIGVISSGPEPPNTEHNDTWVKINGSEFFGQKGSSKVWPRGSGRTPIVAGASGAGWLKAFTNKIDWSWTTRTNDGNGHDIFVKFNNAGVFNVQISGRSKDHIVDKIVLFRNGVNQSTAQNAASTRCGGGGGTPPPPPPPTPPTPPANNQAPTVSFSNLSNGQQVNTGSNVSIGLSSNDSDGNVVKHQVFVNGTLVDTDGANYTPHRITNIAAGNYEIRAVVTDNGGKTAASTINISASGGGTTPPPPPPPTPPTTGNNAPTVSFNNLAEGRQVPVGSTVFVGLNANDSDGNVVKHQIFVNGTLVDTDGSNYTSHPIRNIQAGNYEIRATVTDNDGATASATVNITAGSNTPPPTTGNNITFSLVNASSGNTIGAITGGKNFNSAQGVNIVAALPSSVNANSVRLILSGRKSFNRMENVAPYALYGDRNGTFFSSNLPSGSYTIRATAFSGVNGSGTQLANRSISFSVGNTTSASAKAAFAYPNPVSADGRLSLKLPSGGSGDYLYSISNSNGVIIKNGAFKADKSQTDVDLQIPSADRHSDGVYYITIISGDSKQTIPIIKE